MRTSIMRIRWIVPLVLVLGAPAAGTPLQGLADLARQQRAGRSETRASEGKITTEAAAVSRPGAHLSVAGTTTVPATEEVAAVEAPSADQSEATGAQATGPEQPAATDGEEEASGEVALPDTEEAWRGRFADARTEITRAEQQLSLAEQELGELNNQLLTRSDIYNREYQLLPAITAKQEEVRLARERLGDANQDLERMRTDLRRKGLPAGWGR